MKSKIGIHVKPPAVLNHDLAPREGHQTPSILQPPNSLYWLGLSSREYDGICHYQNNAYNVSHYIFMCCCCFSFVLLYFFTLISCGFIIGSQWIDMIYLSIVFKVASQYCWNMSTNTIYTARPVNFTLGFVVLCFVVVMTSVLIEAMWLTYPYTSGLVHLLRKIALMSME